MQLSLSRVGLLLRRTVILHAPRLLRTAGLFLLLPLIDGIQGGTQTQGSFYENWYWAMLILIGATVTLYSLPELRDADGRQAFLTLPASDTEKWFATWLFTGPILVVVVSLTYALFALLLNVAISSWGGSSGSFALFGSGAVFGCIRTYLLLLHPALLLGAIAFNRSPVVKTLLSSLGVLLVLGIVLAFAIRIIYADQITGFFTPYGDFNFTLIPSGPDGSTTPAWITGTLLSLALLAASYFKFQEKEV